MPRKRPGFSQLGIEIRDELLADVERHAAKFPDESKACVVSKLLASALGVSYDHEFLCPPLGRRPKPSTKPPAPAKKRKK